MVELGSLRGGKTKGNRVIGIGGRRCVEEREKTHLMGKVDLSEE